jgi:AbrB family looped-hinge helix DNA binding protein
MIQTQVSTKYQVVIPKQIRKKIKIKPGQKMDVKLEGENIILSPSTDTKGWKWPEDYIKNLPNPWEGEDSQKYLEEERNSWD